MYIYITLPELVLFGGGIDKLVAKFIWKCKGPRSDKEQRESDLPGIKIYCKVIVIKIL